MSEYLEKVNNVIKKYDVRNIKTIVQEALDNGVKAQSILDDAMIPAMDEIGADFKANKVFMPQMLMAAKTMQFGLDVLKPQLAGDPSAKRAGKAVIGSVEGDVHDIGKNLVSIMLGGAGLDVTDLGVDVPASKFMEALDSNPDTRFVAISSTMTPTREALRSTVAILKGSKHADDVVMVGGATMDQQFSTEIGADIYTADAASAAAAAYEAAKDRPFPDDVFVAPQLTWAVIGCGVIANQMAEALALAGRRIHGVANRTREKAVAFAERHGVERVYDTVEDLYADPEVDAVYVTTPHNTHIRYLRGALAAGKHVLCEKSITLNSAELDEARALAEKNGVVLMDATTILHMPLYAELLRRARAGEFGRMNLAQLNFGSYKEYGDLTNRFYNIDLAGGAMLDIGVYALSLMRLFMESQPTEVVSLGNLASTGVDEAGGVVCRNAEGQLGVVSLTLHSKQPKRAVLSFDHCYVEVEEYPRADEATIVWTEDGRREAVRAGEEAYALCYEMADLEAAVAGDAEKRALLGYAADVMELMTRLRADWGVVYPEER